MAGNVEIPPEDDAWVGICHYNRESGGSTTHVYRHSGSKSLCGVWMGESTGQTLADAKTVSCKRCMTMVNKSRG